MKKRRFKREEPATAPTSNVSLVMEIEEAQRLRGEKREASMSPKIARRRQEALSRQEEKASKKNQRSRKIFFGIGTIAIVLSLTISGYSIFELHKESVDAELALIAKQEEKARLESEHKLINNPDYIETQARERLKMIKPGEILYIFAEQDSIEDA